MKIIGSKFQDFYEFDCYKYGEPSNLPEWFRDTYIIDERDKDDDRSIIVYFNSDLDKFLKKSFLYDTMPKYNWKGKYQANTANMTHIYIKEQIVGIFPFIYYIPQVGTMHPTGKTYYYCGQFVPEMELRSFNADDCIALLTEPEYYKEILVYYGLDYKQCIFPQQIIKAGQNVQPKWQKKVYRNINDPFVTNCMELFDKFGQPIIRYTPDQVERYSHFNKNSYKFFADLNINLSKTPLLRFYPDIQAERDIYTELENWVVANQQEPIHIPDNKTKIISHGFDLKTSFRKM